MPLPFKSLLPMDGHLLMLDYEPPLPVCVPSGGGETSESTSESTSDSQQDGGSD